MEKSRAETAERIRKERRKESSILAMAELCKRECGAEVEPTWRWEQSFTFSGDVVDVRKAGRWLKSIGIDVEYCRVWTLCDYKEMPGSEEYQWHIGCPADVREHLEAFKKFLRGKVREYLRTKIRADADADYIDASCRSSEERGIAVSRGRNLANLGEISRFVMRCADGQTLDRISAALTDLGVLFREIDPSFTMGDER